MITLFEKFKQEDFLSFKEKEEKKLQKVMISKFGKKNMEKFIKDGDIEGVKFLLNNNFNWDDIDENLLTVALNAKQLDIFDFISKLNYAPDYDNPVDSILLQDIIEQHGSNNKKITKDIIEKLKIITEYGYNFEHGQHNLIYLYLTESVGYVKGKHLRKFLDGVEPFIDWLLENYPQKYILCAEYLTPELKNKYKHLEDAIKYNI